MILGKIYNWKDNITRTYVLLFWAVASLIGIAIGFGELVGTGLILLLLTELSFFLDKKKPCKKHSLMIFTVERKLVAFADALFLYPFLNVFRWWVNTQGVEGILRSLNEFMNVAAMVAFWAIVAYIILYGYIWLNSRRYVK